MMEPHIWKIEYNDGMSVGIPEIDMDHKRFASLVNDFNQSVVDRMSLAEIQKRLQLIIDDAALHFSHEERLFREWGYPDADDHAKKHAETMKTLRDMMSQLVSYSLESEWVDAGLKVKDILITHLLTEDMKYAEFYRTLSAGSASKKIETPVM